MKKIVKKMNSLFDAALWLSLNYRHSSTGRIKLDSIYSKFSGFFNEHYILVANKTVISKLVPGLFEASRCFVYEHNLQYIAFENLEEIKVDLPSQSTSLEIPPYCAISYTVSQELQLKCPLTICINGKQVYCDVQFLQNYFELSIMGLVLRSGFSVPVTQHSIDSVLNFLQVLPFCKGTKERFPTQTGCVEEVWSLLYDKNSSENRFRSKKCQVLLSFLHSSNAGCAHCSNASKKAKKRHLDTAKDKKLDTDPHSDSAQTHDGKSQDTFIVLDKTEETDMKAILNDLLSRQQVPAHLRVLMENQLRNSQNMDVHQRRWDPEIISVALGLYLKSPSAYEMLKKTNLPSKRLLQYYKNSVKQPVDISADNLQWMEMVCSRQYVPDFGKHGGLIIDEMAIQEDLVIEGTEDTWKHGMVDMGETNNNISVICKKEKRVELATHALQFVFHGFTGFRWPVAYYRSNPATAHQLYTTFWKCVDELGERGFTIDYVMLDGTSTNRTFTGMLFDGHPAESYWKFHDVFDVHHQICTILDIMHCMKKLRNNIKSSKGEHKAAPGRYLTLNERPIIWDHWQGCLRFNCQSGFRIHRRLTKEHLELTPASKTRNKLATDVLGKDMLYLMKAYQQTLENPEFLASSIELLEHTSVLIDVFCNRNRPISNLTDPRLAEIRKASQFFESWKRTVEESPFQVASKHFLTRETAEDLQSSLVGFLSLCQLHLTSGNSINPGYINSDIVENFRFTRNC